jgi:hypothetical protein
MREAIRPRLPHICVKAVSKEIATMKALTYVNTAIACFMSASNAAVWASAPTTINAATESTTPSTR